MPIDSETVRRIATLARIDLDAAAVERLRDELESVLDHVASLAALDLSSVPATSHPLDLARRGRADHESRCLSPGDATRNSADAPRGLFRVPRVLAAGRADRHDDDA